MNNKEIIEQSLIESSSFSSNVHAIEKVTIDNHSTPSTYLIPSRYYKSKLILLPINVKRFYVYWEFTDTLLDLLNIKIEDVKFYLMDENSNILYEFETKFCLGEYFINKEFSSFCVHIIAGYYKDGEFFKILDPSKKIKIFNKKIKLAKEQKDVWIKKQKGFTEVIHSSMQHFTLGISSASYVKEIERLMQYENEMIENLSSKDLHKEQK